MPRTGSVLPRLWTDSIFTEPVRRLNLPDALTVGVLSGEGVGPEVVDAALCVLSALPMSGRTRFVIRSGGAIGAQSEARCGKPLSPEVIEFCRRVFSEKGAVLSGPGGGRFVYDLRREFDLFCKISP